MAEPEKPLQAAEAEAMREAVIEAKAPETKANTGTKPQTDSPSKTQQQRPQGKGRPRRFAIKINAPFIAHPTTKAKVPTDGSRDEVVSSVQVPGSIKIEPSFLHEEPETPEAPPTVEGAGKQGVVRQTDETADGSKKKAAQQKETRPSSSELDLEEEIVSTASNVHKSDCTAADGTNDGKAKEVPMSERAGVDEPPPVLRLGNDSTTLYSLLMVVNNALAAEMKKNREVHEALSEKLQGPLNVLGLQGRLVRLLFRSMAQHKKKTRCSRRGNPGADAASQQNRGASAPFKGARALFSMPVKHYAKPTTSTIASGGTSVLETGIAKRIPGDPSGDKNDPVWSAIKKSDRLATKRSLDAFVSDYDDDREHSDGYDDVDGIEYLYLPSPSLPNDKNRRHPQSTFDWRRQKKSVLKEEDEETEESLQVAKNRKAATSNTGSRIEERLQQARKEATAAVQKQLTQLTDERDAALFLAETATYERDVVEAEKATLSKDSDQLRSFLRSLVDGEFLSNVWPGEREKGGEAAKNDEYDRRDSATVGERSKAGPQPQSPPRTPPSPKRRREPSPEHGRELSRRSSRQVVPPSPSTPLTPATPVTPVTPVIPVKTPTTPRERQRLIDEARRLLSEAQPSPVSRRHPSVSPPPTPTPSRSSLAATYRITKTRPPIGPGFLASILDVLLAVALLLVRQKDNIHTVAVWLATACLVPLYLFFKWVLLLLLDYTFYRLPRRWRQWNQERVVDGHGNKTDTPIQQQQQQQQGPSSPSPPSPAIPGESAVPLHTQETQLSKVLRQQSHLSQLSQFSRLSQLTRTGFPRDAVAELAVFHFVVFTGFALAGTMAERSLWLDLNADGPRSYFHNFVLQYRQDTNSCAAVPFGPGPFHWCVCVPTFVDPRIVTLPSAYLWNQWRDRARDYVRLASMWMAWGLHELVSLRP